MQSKPQNGNAFVAGWSAESAARMKAAIKRFGSQDKVAERAGISRQSLSGILRFDEVQGTGSRPRYRTLQAICDAIGVSEDEFVGDGSGVSVRMPDYSKPLSGDVRLGGEDYNLIRRWEVKASAGMGVIPSSEATSPGMAFPRPWLIQRGIAADLSGLIRVKGDSMAPAIPDGATVLVQFIPTIEGEGVYVFRRDGQIYVKRLQPVDVSPNGQPSALVVISDNPEYRPEVLVAQALADVRIIGRVRHVMFDVK